MAKNAPGTLCDETHPLPTRQGEIILTGLLQFTGAGKAPFLTGISRAQVFEVTFQPDGSGNFQVLEDDVPVSGLWGLAALQFFGWGGKYIQNSTLSLSASGASNVQFECRYRPY